jgi:GNAT superfamily N-acetyltransferase
MLRRPTARDIHDIAALYHSVWHETQAPFMPAEEVKRRSLAFFEHRVRGLFGSTLVEKRDGVIAGFSSWKGSLLGQLFVTAHYRGSGLASDLMVATEGEMSREGVSIAELHCVVGNNRARRFYERAGWELEAVITETVAGLGGQEEVPFWCMTKSLF